MHHRLVMNDPSKPFTVSLWETHPDEDNDDCSTGADFATEAEARAAIANLDAHFNPVYFSTTPYIELDGPGVNEVTLRPGVKKRAKQQDDDGEWRREQAMEAGMLGGCDAYNEAMGYD